MQTLDKILGIDYPVILAPMFLVTTPAMVRIAIENGITGAIPAMNYRRDGELRKAILQLKLETDKPFGINLIVNKSNTRYQRQLAEILDAAPAFVVSSLGNPKELIYEAHRRGIKVFVTLLI
jgi:nitronate monooxygenase